MCLAAAARWRPAFPSRTPRRRTRTTYNSNWRTCAATNRGVLLHPANWANASAYYGTTPANYYSQFWHNHSIGGLAYGFSYDDNNNQSTTITTPQPERISFGIGW
jgi:hypothetical protein